jgi:hypothetical protein
MNEEERKKFGEKRIFHDIVITQIQNAHAFYTKSRFF